ncbi:unnamed protein product [Clonostachys solani]|uniref:Uncharacterized protein n=1 Tax=Clonostachys solani TaxID=160281 RepID=A0A9N9YZU2_9HYPO|nr:unnamed protein product [Clonostachys solani]
MLLLDLPNELLEAISVSLLDDADISAFSRTCWRAFRSSSAHLYRNNYLHNDGSAMTWALKNQRPETVRRAIDAGIDLVKLHHITTAAEIGDSEVFHSLLACKDKYGAFDQLSRDEKGGFPILSAVGSGCFDIVKTLLETGKVNINIRDRHQHTALHVAAHDGSHEIATLLLEYDADVLAKDSFGRIPLSIAASPHTYQNCPRNHTVQRDRESFLETINQLIAYGSRVEYREPDGETALHSVASAGFCDVVELLATRYGADVNTRDGAGRTPLHTTSLYLGKLEMTQLLVSLGANPNALSKEGQNSLSMDRNAEEPALVADYLLEHGARLVIDIKGATPLHMVGSMGSVELVDVLLKHGADINAQDIKKMTPLHHAAQIPEAGDVVRRLVERGANVGVKNMQGETALACAIDSYSSEVVEFLLKQGASPNCVNRFGVPVIQEAIERQAIDLVQALLDHGARTNMPSPDGQTATHFAALVGNIDIMKLLFRFCAEFNVQDSRGCTPLMVAVAVNSYPVVELLLKMGAFVNASDKKRGTPLHIAADKGSVPIAKLLIAHGAALNARDSLKRTALNIASFRGHAGVVDYLLERGADFSIADRDGNTPFMLASHKQPVVFELLLRKGANAKVTGFRGRMQRYLKISTY